MKTPMIQFKCKLKEVDDNGNIRKIFTYKKTVGKADCNLCAHEHDFYNSDMFSGMLNRAYRKVIGEYNTWSFVDNMPDNVTINTNGFLAIISINLPVNFK